MHCDMGYISQESSNIGKSKHQVNCEHTHHSRTTYLKLIFENLLHPFLDLLEKIYMSYVHWNIVGGASDMPPVPYVSSGFVTAIL